MQPDRAGRQRGVVATLACQARVSFKAPPRSAAENVTSLHALTNLRSGSMASDTVTGSCAWLTPPAGVLGLPVANLP